MKKDIIDISEMSDSKEIYAERPNPFTALFIYSLVALLVIAIVYCCFGTIEVTATANGIIRPNDDVSSISSMAGGRVSQVNYSDGQEVKKGDPLIVVDTSDLKLSLDEYELSAKEYERKAQLLQKFIDGLNKGENPFSEDPNSDENSFYIQFKDFELSQEESADSYQYDKEKNAASISSANAQISNLSNQISGLSAYKKSVQSGKKCASGYPEYSAMYNLYLSDLDVLNSEYEAQKREIESSTAKETYERRLADVEKQVKDYEYLLDSIKKEESVFPVGENSTCKLLFDEYVKELAKYDTEELEGAKEEFKNKTLLQYQQALAELTAQKAELEIAIAGYADKQMALSSLQQKYEASVNQKYQQTISGIENSIQSAQTELLAAQANLKMYQLADDLYAETTDEDGVPKSMSMAKLEKIAALMGEKEGIEKQLKELNAQIDQSKLQIKNGTIEAKCDGIIHVVSPVVSGDILPAGTTVATVIPTNETMLKAQIYVNNADIANIKVGDKIKYNLAALPSRQYGSVGGVVTKVSSDTIVQEGEYSGFYLVEGTIEAATLTDKEGNEGEISVGMQSEVKIVTQNKTIIRYLLEKIDLF